MKRLLAAVPAIPSIGQLRSNHKQRKPAHPASDNCSTNANINAVPILADSCD
jgi:hypothetical protein